MPGFNGTKGSYGSGSFPVAGDGIYRCRLVEIRQTQKPNLFKPGEMRDVWQWFFETKDVCDENGRPYRFVTQTGTGYGAPNAHVTKLLDKMLERSMSQEEWHAFDMDTLFPPDWMVQVDEAMKDDGRTPTNNILSVKPAKNRQQGPQGVKVQPMRVPKETPEGDGFDDPFENE